MSSTTVKMSIVISGRRASNDCLFVFVGRTVGAAFAIVGELVGELVGRRVRLRVGESVGGRVGYRVGFGHPVGDEGVKL